MAVPPSFSKEPPVEDWSREQRKQQRRRARREFLKEHLSFVVGTTSIVILVLFSFMQNWNLWVVASIAGAIIGLVIAYHTPSGLGASLGWAANWLCVVMVGIYGLVLGDRSDNDDSANSITVQACHINRDGPDGYPILVTSKGTYTITEGTYSSVSQPTADGAASMLIPGHTYRLQIDSGDYTYANITGGKEVPNTGQKCRNR